MGYNLDLVYIRLMIMGQLSPYHDEMDESYNNLSSDIINELVG